jgi:hypothetical protein
MSISRDSTDDTPQVITDEEELTLHQLSQLRYGRSGPSDGMMPNSAPPPPKGTCLLGGS